MGNLFEKSIESLSSFSKTNTILIVDDALLNRKILSKMLGNYQIVEAGNGREALEKLQENGSNISAIILDLVMPEMDGYEFLIQKAKVPLFDRIPVIVTTENIKEEHEVKSLRAGAWDFISKPYRPDVIKLRLKGVIARSQLAAFNRLNYLVEFDPLTGLYNRSKFFAATREVLSANPNKKFVFFRFDINRFSLVNSFFGIKEGDNLLRFIASRILETLGKDKLATFGHIEADVFCWCIPYSSHDQFRKIVQYAKKELKEYSPFYDIVPNFGIYIIDDNVSSLDKIFSKTTLASKKSKGDYLNNYTIFDNEMQQAIETEQEIINDMTIALEKEQFAVYLQPKYSLKDNSLVGAEALVRWLHPKKGLIMPNDFIPIFEQNGFISRLDYYMWEKACQILNRWLTTGMKVIPISINISRENMYIHDLASVIEGLTIKYSIPVSLLNLEITESAFTDNPIIMKRIIASLHKKGFIIMMDDFGKGYSSLNILKDLDVDVLKLDMRFLSATENVEKAHAIISSILNMAKSIKIPTIAEGVEELSQIELLIKNGCEYAQGFYYSKAIPTIEFQKLLKEGD